MRDVWRPAVVVAAVLGAYANSFGGMFLFDDLPNINVPAVQRPWPPGWVLSDPRPVTTATFALNYAVEGLPLRPWGYHAVNVGIHTTAALLFYGLVRRTLGRSDVALGAAVIWAVHPLNTQAVTYLVQRMESLMGMFYLLSLYALLRGATTAGRGRVGWYVLAVVASALCMGSKQVAVTLPAVALLFDRCFLAGSFRGAVVGRWPVYLGLAATLGVLTPSFLALASSAGGEVSAGFALKNVTALDYAQSQPGVILHYLKLVLVPWPLCLDYAWDVARGPVKIVLPAVVVGALVVASFVALWKWPRVGFLGTTFFLILAPTSSILPIADLAFEHRMYLPLACLIVLAVVMLAAAVPRGWKPLAVAVAILFTTLTVARNQDYRLDVRMWEDVIAKRPNNTRAVYNLGVLLFNIGMWDEAVPYLEAADRLAAVRPMIGVNLTTSNNNLGTILARRGKLPEAAERYRAALRATPGQPEVTCNLAGVTADLGRVVEAESLYREVLAAQPAYPAALRGLAKLTAWRGDARTAASIYRDAATADPADSAARGQLGLVLLMLGQPTEAADALREACRLGPREAMYRAHLALALDDLGRSAEADREYQAASALNPAWAATAVRAAWDLATHPDPAARRGLEAVLLAREADRATRHQNPEALDALAAAYAAVGRFPEALAAAKDATAAAGERGLTVLAARIRDRLKLYEAGRPYIRPQPGLSR
jgi:Flp pilus assembly protein TadD